ncbi:hypothetical protein SAMN05216474_1375 [Lishizhenia tianjinensis]|uniref:Uncharacterized protein n=1 Tax=Lishizhenia tianjinensis TaxID=477690 RepID=A0A1I6ZI70_9FLAO|nr:hypothetical protein [Lishizhenia tianjinensis]SFT62295.1 hypothetical protein SAMN05216474_1375 [Lishizhenia tianjinensis]
MIEIRLLSDDFSNRIKVNRKLINAFEAELNDFVLMNNPKVFAKGYTYYISLYFCKDKREYIGVIPVEKSRVEKFFKYNYLISNENYDGDSEKGAVLLLERIVLLFFLQSGLLKKGGEQLEKFFFEFISNNCNRNEYPASSEDQNFNFTRIESLKFVSK